MPPPSFLEKTSRRGYIVGAVVSLTMMILGHLSGTEWLFWMGVLCNFTVFATVGSTLEHVELDAFERAIADPRNFEFRQSLKLPHPDQDG